VHKRNLIIGAIFFCAGLGAILFYAFGGNTAKPLIDSSDQGLVARGKAVYANQCAACHGDMLQGQPDWRRRLPNGRLPAPPHDASGHTWHHPDEVLLDIVRNGLVPGKTAPEGYESDMPAYRNLLSDSDIIAVLAYIKSTWPEDIAKLQKEVSEQAR
jgi:S-disulfanyl-L-cysteine oxidoreductase SoxD